MNEQAAKTLEGTEMENSKPLKEEEIREKIGKDDERSGGSSCFPVQSTSIGVAEESKDSEFKVLPSAQLSETDFKSNFSFSSERLSEVPVEYSLQPLVSDDEIKDQVRVTLEEPLIGNTGRHVETHNLRKVNKDMVIKIYVHQPDVLFGSTLRRLQIVQVLNYYRCTSAGCPVRKHTEKATDSSSAVIVSYTGVHDHEMPVPKKTRGPTSDPLVATASPGSLNNVQINETEANYYRCTSAGCPVRKHTEKATDSSSAVIVSYTGVHDHEMPVPKKTRGPTSDPLVATASPGSLNNVQINETEA
ncbi:probable WRKY transcription factor 32 [Olea europaea subsp. europaea]|uniref:Probable WRKY transcription factor 32 n=1 Tax=Olea europaea subsp. europaea TaxID=158383 RepID=A0A8S0TPY8_OLEEU|nr:probable WRKY transcription factor 32 [Olea europaea subsp. europaea]